MYRNFRLIALAAALAGLAAPASPQGRAPFEAPPARTIRAQNGQPLTLPSTASPRAVLAQYLRGQGRSEATVQSLVEAARTSGRGGVLNARFEQRVGGLPVYGTYARAAFSARGELVNLIENLVNVRGAAARARIGDQEAIDAAVAHLYPELRTVPAGFFRSAPTASRVAIPNADGSLSAGFLVQTWTERTNDLHETLIDGTGAVVAVEHRTNQERYRVFRINPLVTPQAIVNGPGAGNDASPTGWLFGGTQGSTHIAGNNASAYLDVVSDNESDSDGAAITDGQFVARADLTVQPSEKANREVAVQNLFFLNNLIHDELYRHGFTEATANFQEDNFGLGGRGSDSVNAEAQDGGGTDNANFATPRDGQNPRMQMYLWTGLGVQEVVVGGNVFPAQGAEFGPEPTTTGVTGPLVLANDGVGTASDGCEALPPMAGAVALIDRGTCDFTVKVKNAQVAGALAAIVANNRDGDRVITMGGEDATITIPAVFVSQNSGAALRTQTGQDATVRKADPPPLSRDGDIDSDIVFHEYCHGLTWRMIGRMSGLLSGAIGEGMSDLCAILMNSADTAGADVIGEYSASDPLGIRRARYSGYPNTYGDVLGASVHNDGEVYAAIGYRMLQLFGEARKRVLFGHIVDGMNFTPENPTYEAMRDGILTSISLSGGSQADACRVWQAFAQYGVGVGASGTTRGPRVLIAESFAVPASCQAP